MRAFAACALAAFAAAPAGAPSAAAADPGFAAEIAGAYEGRVAGPGVLLLLPEAGFEKRGYFVLADGRGLRPHGVTFVLPRGIAPGTHALESPGPLALGSVPSVRVDRDTGAAVVSSERITTGTLELAAFPEDAAAVRGAELRGRFEFETEDRQGRRIAVTGRFAFTAE